MTKHPAAQAPPPAGTIPGLPTDVEPGTKLIPQEGVNAFGDVLSTTLWIVLAVIMLVAVSSLGFAAVGRASRRPEMMERGLIVFAWCLGLAVLAGIAIPLVNNFYNLT